MSKRARRFYSLIKRSYTGGNREAVVEDEGTQEEHKHRKKHYRDRRTGSLSKRRRMDTTTAGEMTRITVEEELTVRPDLAFAESQTLDPLSPRQVDTTSVTDPASCDTSTNEGTCSDFDEELDDKLREEVEKDIPPSITDLSLAEKATVRRILIIWNPYAGNKRGKRVMRSAKRMIEREGIKVETIRLLKKGHAEEICEKHDFGPRLSDSDSSSESDDESGEACKGGIDILAAVGGDGTFHECVNGMMKRLQAGRESTGKPGVPLAMLAAGTGNSFMRELHVKSLNNAVYHIIRGVHYPIDVCKVTFGDGDFCYAFNSLHWGLASKVNVRAEKLRWMGSAIRYTTAAFYELLKGTTTKAKITAIDEKGETIELDDEFCLAIANNIITAAKGMKMAPEAKLDDGLIDLILVRSAATTDLLNIFRKTYDGTHTDLPYVDYLKVKSFSITPYKMVESLVEEQPEEIQIEEIIDVDGELKGITPFSCEVIPRALRVIL